jgi:hypothetical protein
MSQQIEARVVLDPLTPFKLFEQIDVSQLSGEELNKAYRMAERFQKKLKDEAAKRGKMYVK